MDRPLVLEHRADPDTYRVVRRTHRPLAFKPCLRFMLCSIQQSAALALGRLASYSDDLAEAVVQNEILPQLVSEGGPAAPQQCAGQVHGQVHVLRHGACTCSEKGRMLPVLHALWAPTRDGTHPCLDSLGAPAAAAAAVHKSLHAHAPLGQLPQLARTSWLTHVCFAAPPRPALRRCTR